VCALKAHHLAWADQVSAKDTAAGGACTLRVGVGTQAQAALSIVSAMQRQEKLALLMPAFDDELKALAEEISETRFRLGIPDTDVFGGSGFTMRKLQLQLRQGLSTVQEGIDFFTLGLRMLGSDIGYSSSLFGRASLGNTLKPREVSVCVLDTVPSVAYQPEWAGIVAAQVRVTM
jgi:hypothetical protein